MARPREFDIDRAVKNAMDVFWEHGYGSTSLPALLKGMGIARGSLYKAFGSKKALFLRTLDLYEKSYIEPAVAMLSDTKISGDQRLKQVFTGAVGRIKEGDRRGCLLCNTAAGASYEDLEIEKVVNAQLHKLTAAFCTALTDVEAFASASMETKMTEAHSLTLSYVGLRVMTRGGLDANALNRAAIDTTTHLTSN